MTFSGQFNDSYNDTFEIDPGVVHSSLMAGHQQTTTNSDTCTVDVDQYQQLKQQATRLEQMLTVMPAGVVVIDGKGIVTLANTQARDFLGEPLEGQVWRDIIQRSFRPQADDGHEVSLHDGRKVKLSITPLVDEPGQMIVMTDLTETRQLQQRISHMQRLSSLGKTVASLVHQIRTPLSAAMLYAANLSGNNLDNGSRERFTDKLQNRLQELESQVNDMLLFAKSGEQNVLQRFRLSELLNAVSAGTEAMVDKHQANLTIAPLTEDPSLMANQSALVGAIQNLIHNATQIVPKGAEILIQAAVENGVLRLDVSDNGPGIDEKAMRHIFEPFFTTRSQGTGLGLAVVQSVAKSHKGTLSAQNNAFGGACFTLQLPILMNEESGDEASEQYLQAAGE